MAFAIINGIHLQRSLAGLHSHLQHSLKSGFVLQWGNKWLGLSHSLTSQSRTDFTEDAERARDNESENA